MKVRDKTYLAVCGCEWFDSVTSYNDFAIWQKVKRHHKKHPQYAITILRDDLHYTTLNPQASFDYTSEEPPF